MQERICGVEKNGYLDLSNMGLSVLPDLPKELYAIKMLCLNDNKLTNIDLTHFSNLMILDISDNPIESVNFLPDGMEELMCKSCRLTSIVSHPNLKRLHCPFNSLKQLGEYNNLMDLNCEDNKIQVLQSYNNLEELVCTNNPLSIIKQQPKLKHLDCANTKIQSIGHFGGLETLRFSNTGIKEIDYIKTLKGITVDDPDILLSQQYKLKSCIADNNEMHVLLESKKN